jgi:hypothetical protein
VQTLQNFVEPFGSVGMPDSVNEDTHQVPVLNSFNNHSTDYGQM